MEYIYINLHFLGPTTKGDLKSLKKIQWHLVLIIKSK